MADDDDYDDDDDDDDDDAADAVAGNSPEMLIAESLPAACRALLCEHCEWSGSLNRHWAIGSALITEISMKKSAREAGRHQPHTAYCRWVLDNVLFSGKQHRNSAFSALPAAFRYELSVMLQGELRAALPEAEHSQSVRSVAHCLGDDIYYRPEAVDELPSWAIRAYRAACNFTAQRYTLSDGAGVTENDVAVLTQYRFDLCTFMRACIDRATTSGHCGAAEIEHMREVLHEYLAVTANAPAP